MGYDHSQRSPLFETYLVIGSINCCAIVIAYVLAPIYKLWWLYGALSSNWYWVSFLCSARYYKYLNISDEQKESLKIAWDHPNERWSIQIKYTNISSFKRITSSVTKCNGCCAKQTLVINANGGCPCCSCICRSCDNTDMIQLNLTTMLVYNACGRHRGTCCYCQCANRSVSAIKVSTDNLNGFVDHLSSKGISEEPNPFYQGPTYLLTTKREEMGYHPL